MAEQPRLFADAMLGTLARWLRILGLDVEYDAAIGDTELVERAHSEGRVILTRDRRLVERRQARRWVLIRADPLEEQLAQVIGELSLELRAADLLRRCLDCNRDLEPLPTEEARPRVPPYVARTQSRFRRCPSCDRIFWRATHVEGIERRLSDLGIELDDR